jgi:hypothetical protein
MSLLKYSPALVRRNLMYPTVKGALGINPPVPGAEEVEVYATRSRSAVNVMKMRALALARERAAAAARGLGAFSWGDILPDVINQGFDITKTILKTRTGGFETVQTVDPKTGQLLTSSYGRQPSNFALPLNLSTSQTGVAADAGGGLIIVGGAALLLVLMLSMSRSGGRR